MSGRIRDIAIILPEDQEFIRRKIEEIHEAVKKRPAADMLKYSFFERRKAKGRRSNQEVEELGFAGEMAFSRLTGLFLRWKTFCVKDYMEALCHYDFEFHVDGKKFTIDVKTADFQGDRNPRLLVPYYKEKKSADYFVLMNRCHCADGLWFFEYLGYAERDRIIREENLKAPQKLGGADTYVLTVDELNPNLLIKGR